MAFHGDRDTQTEIRERIRWIKSEKTNRLGKVTAGIIMAMAVFASSLTTLAYDEIRWWGASGEKTFDFPTGEIKVIAMKNGFFFVNDKDNQNTMDNLIYPKEYIDENGAIYPLNQVDTLRVQDCIHDFCNVKVLEHHISLSGKCEVDYYDAERCKNCGYLQNSTLTQIRKFDECIHAFE